MALIGLSGFARAGKDSVAAVLVQERGFVRVAFADRMRAAILALDPLVLDEYGSARRLSLLVDSQGWERAKTLYPEVRRLLQRFGTEAGREIHGEECWIDAAFRDLPDGHVVFSDVRFRNEADRIRKAGGKIWRIERPGIGPASAHPSETELVAYDFDLVIENDGTLDELRDVVLRSTPAGRRRSPS